MKRAPELLDHLRSIAAVRAEFPRGRGRGLAARVRTETSRLCQSGNLSAALLAAAIVRVCDACGVAVDDVVTNEALRDEVIDAAMPTFFALCAHVESDE